MTRRTILASMVLLMLIVPIATVWASPPQSQTYSCPLTSSNKYRKGAVEQWDEENPIRRASQNPEKNWLMRGYERIDGLEHDLVWLDSTDPNYPPQIATIFSPDRTPIFMSLYRVHDWVDGKPGPVYTNWEVTAMGMLTTPGEIIQPTWHSYNIGEPGGVGASVVLYADAHSLTLGVSRNDSAIFGYAIHYEGLCTDPHLMALYRSLDRGARYMWTGTPRDGKADYDLPIVLPTDTIGTARGTELVIAIRDSGSFLDPRSEGDWWKVHPPHTFAPLTLTPRPTARPTRTPTSVPLAAPAQILPRYASLISTAQPLLAWHAIADGSEYRVQVDNDPTFASPEIDTEVQAAEFGGTALTDGLYYWRVQGISPKSQWSTVWRFSIDATPPPPAALRFPMDTSITRDITPTFVWGWSIDAPLIQIQVATNAHFNGIVIDETVLNLGSYTPPKAAPLQAGVTYYWRVRAADSIANWSEWSVVWSVSIP